MIDPHAHPMIYLYATPYFLDLGNKTGKSQTDFVTMKEGGVDHVGLGSDFGGIHNPVGLETAAGYPLITYHLLKRGYNEEDIKKILGGNVLRVFEGVHKYAQDQKTQ